MKNLWINRALAAEKKIHLFIVAICSAAATYAVPAPTNVHWDGCTIKWELEELTNDSVYQYYWLTCYTEDDLSLTGISGYATATTSYDLSEYMFHGRKYYVTLKVSAVPNGEGGSSVQSEMVTSPLYTVPGEKDTIELPDVTLNADGYVRWGYIGYIRVRATIQKKEGDGWENIAIKEITDGRNMVMSFDRISTPGTYRAVAEALQGEDVVRRGISDELEVEQMFTVKFDAQSLFANPEALIVAPGGKAVTPAIPDEYKNQIGNHFFAWCVDAAGTTPWSFNNDVVTQDTTLYAKWVEVPDLNPVWDDDTCRWTLAENLWKFFRDARVSIYTEGRGEVSYISFVYTANERYYDTYFPGRKYMFSINLKDYYENLVTDSSALRTTDGEATILPLENMTVADPTNARITWHAPKNLVYIRHGEIRKWNKDTQEWDEFATYEDLNPVWYNSVINFSTSLSESEYYRIHVTLNQREYVIYEGELFYGTDPTALDNTAADTKATKRLVNGQLLIEKNGKTYNAQGSEVK